MICAVEYPRGLATPFTERLRTTQRTYCRSDLQVAISFREQARSNYRVGSSDWTRSAIEIFCPPFHASDYEPRRTMQ